jgi:hypothetical protein
MISSLVHGVFVGPCWGWINAESGTFIETTSHVFLSMDLIDLKRFQYQDRCEEYARSMWIISSILGCVSMLQIST